MSTRTATLLAGGIVALIACISIFSFSPGMLKPPPDDQNQRKTQAPQASLPYGDERVDVSIPKQERPKRAPKKFEAPFQQQPLPLPDFTNRIPTQLPSMEPPVQRERKPAGPSEKALAVYAKHAEMTRLLGEGLNKGFKLDKMPSAPTTPGESKFSSAYVLLDDNESVERIDLMSIVKDESMDKIKTAKDALNSLVEESNEVNIVEAEESFLIYDISGGKGYQVGKISLDDNGIYISGYVNYTTNRMPEFLRKQWISKLKPV